MTTTEHALAQLFPNGIDSLERLPKNWDKKTAERLVYIGGSGNMFGGSGKLVHIVVHGDNSVTETGTIEIVGRVTYNYNIGRGANGPTESTATYYPVNRKTGEYNTRMEYQSHIHGKCSADDALAAVLGVEKDWANK